MLSRKLALSLILTAACIAGVATGAHAEEGGGAPPGGGNKHRGGGGAGRIHMILKNAADLNLTDDQKKELQTLADSAKDGTTKPEDVKAKLESILTKDQVEKLKSLAPKHGEKGGDGPKDGEKKDGGDKKDANPPAGGGDEKK